MSIDRKHFIRAALKAGEFMPKEVRMWWYCPRCDEETDDMAWFMPVQGGPIVDENGIPRCPDCGTELAAVSDEVLEAYR